MGNLNPDRRNPLSERIHACEGCDNRYVIHSMRDYVQRGSYNGNCTCLSACASDYGREANGEAGDYSAPRSERGT